MAKLKLKDWKPGALIRNGLPLWTQRTEDGWFAKIDDEPGKLMAISGPWPSQSDAEYELLDRIDRICIGTDGE